MNGIDRIRAAFDRADAEGRAALMPYFTLGYPTSDASYEIIAALARSGADLIELGMPFSDPLADGPTIQRSTQVALEQGMTTRACLELARRLRQSGVETPLLLMGYLNPILAYGVERFIADAAVSGADGVILPDLPPEEAGEAEDACRRHGLALVYLLSPASTEARIRLVAERASGFIYLVSVLGVTGARQEAAHGLEGFIERVRAHTGLPLAVGFGVSNAAQVARIGALADGVIVGSALIQAAGQADDPVTGASEYFSTLTTATRRSPQAALTSDRSEP